jgi:glutamine amidotransferase
LTGAEPGPLVAVLDYGIGNLRSAEKGLQRAGADAHLTADRGLIAAAAGVVLPGVGAFGRCMEALRETGLDEVARDVVGSGRPFLGICIGMQLLYKASDEDPGVEGLGLMAGRVRRLSPNVKHPQMQWNVLKRVRPSAILQGLPPAPWVYFNHSFAPDDGTATVATCDYGGAVVAAVEQGPLWATQFHPEKSSADGLRLLGNFVAACSR